MRQHCWKQSASRLSFCLAFLTFGSVLVADLNPAALSLELPKDIHWKENPNAATAVLAGDPAKPGLYVQLIKWHPNHWSKPHSHPNDRFIYVVSGTWWVGTSLKGDPESAVAVPAGSFVTHFAKGVHYDGAKDSECVIEIVGMGPATVTPAE